MLLYVRHSTETNVIFGAMLHYVVETILKRSKVVITPFPTAEAAMDFVRCAVKDMLPSYKLHPYEVAAGMTALVPPKNVELCPAFFEEYSGFSFDGGKYVVFVSKTLAIQFGKQRLKPIHGWPRYAGPDASPLSAGAALLVVRYNFMYGGQGTCDSLGVFTNVDVAVCELWRDTFGALGDSFNRGFA